MRNCIAVRSVTMPILPPRASISRTICPFAMPPTAGLHDICAILFISIVTRHVCAPRRAAAAAASHPACPAPITMTSYFRIIFMLSCCVSLSSPCPGESILKNDMDTVTPPPAPCAAVGLCPVVRIAVPPTPTTLAIVMATCPVRSIVRHLRLP